MKQSSKQSDFRFYVSIDVGGTAIKYGILDECGAFIKKASCPTEAKEGGKRILSQLIEIVENAGQSIAEINLQGIFSGICVSTAGMVDCEQGKILYSGELIPAYTGTEIKKTLENRFHVPCSVENDVNCAGLAELVSGAAKGFRNVLCLTVGTGIGGCIILNGEVYHGHGNSAGEIGYMYMDGSEFQTLGAGSIMSKKIAEQRQDIPENWSGRRIFEAAKQGDTECIRVIDEMTEILGKGIANICYVLNPQIVVLGGGVMEQREMMEPLIKDKLEKYLRPIVRNTTRIAFAEHGNDAGMLGAFYHFRKDHHE